jgi:hypothetical protein
MDQTKTQKTKSLKSASTNDLYELLHLLSDITDSIEKRFLHVEDYVPQTLKNEVEKLRNKSFKELEKRGY